MYPLRMRLLLHQQQLESMRQQHQVLINKHQNSLESTKHRYLTGLEKKSRPVLRDK